MRRLLFALPFALLPLAMAQAQPHDNHDHAHATLETHEHGAAKLDVVLDGNTLELALDSPAMNLVGFEHAPGSDADKAKIAAARQHLEQPLKLFGLAQAAGCKEDAQDLDSPLFSEAGHDEEGDEHDHGHADINAHYQLTCTTPDKLTQVDLTSLFKTFPATQKIAVQVIGPNGQKGLQATPGKPLVAF